MSVAAAEKVFYKKKLGEVRKRLLDAYGCLDVAYGLDTGFQRLSDMISAIILKTWSREWCGEVALPVCDHTGTVRLY